jgi:hypothetical protein
LDSLDRRRKAEGSLDYFRRTGKFADFMLSAWAEVEASVDSVILTEYGLYEKLNAESQADFILNQSFKAKLDLLKRLGKVGNKEYSLIVAFSRARNHLFHGRPFEPWATQIGSEEKKRYIELGWQAVRAATEVTVLTFRERLEDLNIISPWEDE